MVTKWFALFCTRSLTSPSYEEKLNKIRARSKFNTRRLSLYFMDFVRFPWYCDRMCSPHFFFQFARTSIIQHGHAPQHFVPVSSTGISFWLKSAACEAVDPLQRSRTLSIFCLSLPGDKVSFENIAASRCRQFTARLGDGKQIKNLKKK